MPPITVMVKPVSGICNMRCKYCFYTDVVKNRTVQTSGTMNISVLKVLMQKVFDYAEESAAFVFQGGEPTLAGIEFYETLISLQKQYNTKRIPVQNAIQTNGYELNEAWAELFRKHRFLVGLSMDGTKELHDNLRVDFEGKGTYTRVKQSAELLSNYQVDFNILCVVNNFVARHPKKVFAELKKYRYLQFIPCLDDFDGNLETYSLTNARYTQFLNGIFDEYYRCLTQNQYVSVRNFDNYIQIMCGKPPENCAMSGRCGAYFLIEWDGSVYPCDFYVLDEWKLGNITQNGFSEMYGCEKMSRFVADSLRLPEKCKDCQWFSLCRGGCKRDREPLFNGIVQKNRLCESYQSFFAHSFDRMKKIARQINGMWDR